MKTFKKFAVVAAGVAAAASVAVAGSAVAQDAGDSNLFGNGMLIVAAWAIAMVVVAQGDDSDSA
ncbi:MAG: hypothetical protein MUF14_06925 [Hyphomonadaceae bacterium]|nr:hypothetical protein [Hyphomonadaceae bacterium]